MKRKRYKTPKRKKRKVKKCEIKFKDVAIILVIGYYTYHYFLKKIETFSSLQ